MSSTRYSFEHRPPAAPDAQLLYVTRATSDNDWHSMEHSHYFAELFFVTSGVGHIQIDNQKIRVRKNDLILINPNVPHTELGNRTNPWEYLALGIEGVQFYYPQKNVPYDYSIHTLAPETSDLTRYLTILENELKTQNPDYESACTHLLNLILISVSRTTKQEFVCAPAQKTTKECKLVEQYINENFQEDITLESLSELVHINKYYLAHAFKTYKGISPINYLIQRRIEESRYLLGSTNYPISKIAEIVGFSSQSYFSQTFKRLTGISPNAYRRQKKP